MPNNTERREFIELTDAQVEIIAERAAEKAFEKVYMEVGKSVLNRLAWVLGITVISLLLFLAGKDALIKL